MADNVTLNTGSGGDTIAADDIGGVKTQRVKVQHGADGSATDVSTASPLPVDDDASQTLLTSILAAVDQLEGYLDTVEALLAAATPAGTNAIGRVGHDQTGVGDGIKAVTTAGTRVTLAGSTAAKRVNITAHSTNTGTVVVGGATVVAAAATRQGLALHPGESTGWFDIDNLTDVQLDSVVNGEGVAYIYTT